VKTSTTLRWPAPASEVPSFAVTWPVAQPFEPASAFCAEPPLPVAEAVALPPPVADVVEPLLVLLCVALAWVVGVLTDCVEPPEVVLLLPLPLEPQPVSAVEAPRMSAPTENALMNTRPFMARYQLSMLVDLVDMSRARFQKGETTRFPSG
jgi:hypothetical protein